ncbi:clathrin adaptor, mu subunit [Microthyrium microscopicum]|uniref:Clathrin adaptor, mu subunit n=1 Tax=Microthyrium microscopicum TaxID=703497 RepID=A0A6A6UVF5_9PEZI|nr:clathrin adaptor, mu subunit [Microthyrium microscopicum]
MATIDALYIFDENNSLVLSHVWTSRPPSAQVLLPLYLAHSTPRPSLIYESSTNPSTLVHSIVQDGLILLCPTSQDIDPLIVLEFLHRIVDVFEDFLGSPLLPSKISSSYDVVAQLLGEMCDCGAIATTEPNALRDLVEAPSWMNKLLGNVGLTTPAPSLSHSRSMTSLSNTSSANAPTIPWRKSNVRHTSNELYADIVETLHIITAPSGQPLSAFAHGSIVFTSKVSGVPDLFLSLGSQAGGPNALATTLNLPVFHPCVRLTRWKDRPGDLSFVPPDGRFLLMGYEVDLLGPDYAERALGATKGKKTAKSPLHVPATVAVRKGLGSTGADFEVRLALNPTFASRAGNKSDAFKPPTGFSAAKTAGTSVHPVVEDVWVKVPIPTGVRSLGDLKPSRGEARWAPGEDKLEWRVSGKDVGVLVANSHGITADVVATLRCSVSGATEDDAQADDEVQEVNRQKWDYDEGDAYQSSKDMPEKPTDDDEETRNKKKARANESLMPSSASVSFQVKGWLASGIKVDKLVIDTQRSLGLGAGVKPYKGVKYVTVSQDGVETRC